MENESIKDLDTLLGPSLGNRRVKKFHLENLVGNGENYGSVMLALDLVLEDDEELHLVAKISPSSEFLRKMFNLPVTFKKEVLFYSDCLPALKDFQARNSTKDSLNCFAKYYCSRMDLDPDAPEVGPHCCLVLENLKIKGYRNLDRIGGCDLRTAKIILKDLAAFHAVPIAMKLKEPGNFVQHLLPALKTNPYNRDSFGDELESKMIDNILLFFREQQLFSDDILERLEVMLHKNAHHFYDEEMQMDEPFATMTHFDFWLNNTMQLIDEDGFVIDNLIVDMQTIKLGNPANDLLLFIYTSVKTDVVQKHYGELLDYYFSQFINNLYELNIRDVTSFTREAFDEIVVRAAQFTGIFHIMFMIRPICAIKEKAKDMSDITMENMDDIDLDTEAFTAKMTLAIQDFIDRKWI